MTKKWTIEYCTLKVNENSNHDFEYRMIAKNGKVVWLRDIVNLKTDKQLVYVAMIDVPATKESEKN
jgi:hypothetical protein